VLLCCCYCCYCCWHCSHVLIRLYTDAATTTAATAATAATAHNPADSDGTQENSPIPHTMRTTKYTWTCSTPYLDISSESAFGVWTAYPHVPADVRFGPAMPFAATAAVHVNSVHCCCRCYPCCCCALLLPLPVAVAAMLSCFHYFHSYRCHKYQHNVLQNSHTALQHDTQLSMTALSPTPCAPE
jgi:hypothetical protein